MVCDPSALYAYWELCDAVQKGAEQIILRLQDVTPICGGKTATEAHACIDYTCELDETTGMLAGIDPDRTYRAELLLRQRGKRLCVAATSNSVTTPPSGPSPRDDVEILTIAWGRRLPGQPDVASEDVSVDAGLDEARMPDETRAQHADARGVKHDIVIRAAGAMPGAPPLSGPTAENNGSLSGPQLSSNKPDDSEPEPPQARTSPPATRKLVPLPVRTGTSGVSGRTGNNSAVVNSNADSGLDKR